ncbi:DUF5810 domain-containing protein [Haloarchaeobius sp. TZWWS8]|uniref:DUF5810 domain-containing protein n=1 Tax=Haloarchaeobius sp. TZWWS8 TaxID=3446121 RepID=UPI003EBD34B4
MGYACPVCEVPHADAEHLANHLAFTAMLHADEHEQWLDEHAPDWGGSNPETLAPVVAEHVEEAEFDGVFDDTTDGHDHQHGQSFEDAVAEQAGGIQQGRGDLTSSQEAAIEEARELTRQMRENREAALDDDDDADDAADTENE